MPPALWTHIAIGGLLPIAPTTPGPGSYPQLGLVLGDLLIAILFVVVVVLALLLLRQKRRQEQIVQQHAQDIAQIRSAMHRADEALRRSEDRFRRAFHASPVPIAITVRQTDSFIDVNESFLRLSGYTRDKVINHTATELHLWPHTEERTALLQRLESAGAIRESESQLRNRQGELRQVLAAMETIELDRQPCLLTILHDITERKQAEERLRHSEERFQLIARATNDTVWDWDLNRNKLWWNEGIHTLFGYSADKLETDATWWEQHIHPEDRDRVIEGRRRIIENEDRFWSDEYRFARTDGTFAEVLDRAYVIRNSEDRPVRMLGALMDITERKRFLTELAHARDAAVEALRLKSEFLANISHEVRTPLNGIVGMTVLLQDTDLNREQRDYAETIQSSSDALLTIINDILDFSKIEAGKLHFEALSFELRATVDSTIEILADRAQARHVELVTLIDGDVPDHLRGDSGRLRQVITNLVVNALKFTEQGEVVIHVSRASEGDTSVVLLFSIRDTGIGIPKEALPYLFQAFSQVDGSTTRKHGGTGLGLTISKQLVELMGGQIGVESTLGEGSTFWFTVRIEKGGKQDLHDTRFQDDFSSSRVLVADHHATTRQLLLSAVATLGAEGVEATSGSAVLEQLRNAASTDHPFHLAVIDQNLDAPSGVETTREIKKDPALRALPLVMILPRKQSTDTAFLRSMGISAVVSRPVRQQLLVQAMARLLRAPSSHETRLWLDRRKSGHPGSLTPLLDDKRPCRILIAEDNPINQRVALALLEKLGYKAQAVATGAEVLRAHEAVSYDLILMDCQLPEIDGFEATREIRRLEQDSPPPGPHRAYIIAMTAFAHAGARERCLASGMDDYLSKPIRFEALAEALQKALAGLPVTHSAKATPSDDVLPPPPPPDQVVDPAAIAALRELKSERQPDPVTEMVGMFFRQASACLQEIELSVTRYEARAVEKAAHNLKGSASTLGAGRLAELSGLLEQEASKGSLQVANRLLNQVRVEYSKVREALHTLTDSTPPSAG